MFIALWANFELAKLYENMKTNKICIITFLLFFSTIGMAGMEVVHLSVNYLQNPLGLDERPMLSWQIRSNERNIRQTAYEVLVASTKENLNRGIYLYDSGKINDSHSVQIAYNGPLSPCTRYYYKVRVWDNHKRKAESTEDSWFETGLGKDKMQAWSGAQWIGSSKVLLSPYRSTFVASYDSDEASAFVFGQQSEEKYCQVTLKEGQLTISHFVGGKEIVDGRENVAHVLQPGRQHIRLNVFSSQYARTYRMDVYINGQKIENTHKVSSKQHKTLEEILTAGRQASFEIAPEPDNKQYRSCRLWKFGKRGGISALTLEDPVWHTTLYSEGAETMAGGAPMLRKEFTADKKIKQARLYMSARGIYECYINGRKVGSDFMNPGWSDYRYRMFYNTFDVTHMIHLGENAIGACLGNGWWSGFNGYQTDWQDQYGISLSLIGKLVIDFTDGTRKVVITGPDWTCFDDGPIRENDIQNGEVYDATREQTGWTMPHFNQRDWKAANVYPQLADTIEMQAYVGSTIQARDTLSACGFSQPLSHIYIYDLGQNMVGTPMIRINGRRGQVITLRYGEMLWPKEIPSDPVKPYTKAMYEERQGQLYTDNYRSAFSTDTYICKGGEEIISPTFTSHGFRYLQIEGLDSPLPLKDVKGLVMHSLAGRQTSNYETSDSLVNRLYENILWGQRGNFLAVPTDCPQRDERLGYTGDGQIFALSSTYNYNVAPFMHRWLYSVRDNQDNAGNFADFSPKVGIPNSGTCGGGAIGWSEAGIIVPWHLYNQYADKDILRVSYASMQRYMNYLESRSTDGLQPCDGLGDWLSFDETNNQLTNTAYWAYDALLMKNIASILGKDKDAEHYDKVYNNIKKAFNSTFVDPLGRTYTPAGYMKGLFIPKKMVKDSLEDTQTSYVLPLKANLFYDNAKAVSWLLKAIAKQNGHLSTGFVGTPYLNEVLSDNGCSDTAYGLFLEKTFPSWLYPVTQGATTIWERWNSYTRKKGFGPVRMNSFNHYSYGAVEEWMMQYTLGIKADPEEPGYKHILLEPHTTNALKYVRGHLDTMYGRISCGWYNKDGQTFYHVEIPANTTATILLGGKKRELVSGKYEFKF